MSGVGVDDECMNAYNDLKLGHKYKFVIYKMSDDNSKIVVDKTSTETDYNAFVSAIPPTDCRYGVVDFEFTADDGGQRNKIVFVNWAPETSKIKSKMLYAASKESFKKKLVGLAVEVQATDLSEIQQNVVLEKCNKK